jgi:hypothetical protein
MEFVGHVLRHTPQPKHLFCSNINLLFSSLLALNWHLVAHFPQLMHVSRFVAAMNLLETTALDIPNLTRALREWQQHEQQLQMTSGFSLPLNV